MLTFSGYLRIAGIDACSDTYIRLAMLNPEDQCSYTEDLHRYRDLAALTRWWARRDDNALAVAILAGANTDLEHWLEECQIAVYRVQQYQLHPFLREAREFEVPRRYRLAHALAKCTAMRLTAPSQLKQLQARYDELALLLRDAHADLHKLTAATRTSP